MKRFIRALARRRAHERCEYCRVPQSAIEAVFHVEHVIAQQHGADDDPSNLALSCDRCNLIKGPNLSGIDPDTGDIVRLFHPRQDEWFDHFRLVGELIFGKTPTGRATVALLRLNDPARIKLRSVLIRAGEFL